MMMGGVSNYTPQTGRVSEEPRDFMLPTKRNRLRSIINLPHAFAITSTSNDSLFFLGFGSLHQTHTLET